MAKQIVLACDKCGGVADVSTYKLWREGETRAMSVDLCPQCAQPITSIMGELGAIVPAPGGRSGRMVAVKLRKA